MMLSWDTAGDFVEVVDGLRPITLLRPGSSFSLSVLHALRAPATTTEARASGGKVIQSDVVWHLPAAEATSPPALGDVIVEAEGRRWTILAVRQAAGDSRWRCVARNLAVVHGLDQIVAIEQAVYSKSEHGAQRVAWRPWRTGVAARIQPVQSVTDDRHQRQATTSAFVVYLAQSLELDHAHRITTLDGAAYQVVGCRKAERIDALMEVDVIRAG